jgi:hypothetical protein
MPTYAIIAMVIAIIGELDENSANDFRREFVKGGGQRREKAWNHSVRFYARSLAIGT